MGDNLLHKFQLTRMIPQQFAHQHHGRELERLEKRDGRERDVSKRLVLTPAAEHVRYRREAVLVYDRGSRRARLEVYEEHPRHDHGPEAVGEYQGVGVGEVLSGEPRIFAGEHSLLGREVSRDVWARNNAFSTTINGSRINSQC